MINCSYWRSLCPIVDSTNANQPQHSNSTDAPVTTSLALGTHTRPEVELLLCSGRAWTLNSRADPRPAQEDINWDYLLQRSGMG